jgi:hypothetical protein
MNLNKLTEMTNEQLFAIKQFIEAELHKRPLKVGDRVSYKLDKKRSVGVVEDIGTFDCFITFRQYGTSQHRVRKADLELVE